MRGIEHVLGAVTVGIVVVACGGGSDTSPPPARPERCNDEQLDIKSLDVESADPNPRPRLSRATARATPPVTRGRHAA